jgi:hypothetical protein
MLQVGGVQEAVIVAPPRLLWALAEFETVEVVRELNETTSGFVVLQVRGGLGSVNPRVSTTVAFSVTELPLLTTIEFVVLPEACTRMYFTRQVVTGRELLAVPETVANIWVTPGLAAVISTWFGRSVGTEL